MHRHFFEAGWAQRSGEATLVDAIDRVERAGVPGECIRVSVRAQWWHVNNYRFLLPRSRFERERTTTVRECGPMLVADRLPDDVPGQGLVVALEHAAGLALTVSPDGLDPGTRERLAAEGLVLPGPMCAPLPAMAYRAVLSARLEPPATRGAQAAARVEVRHAGERAPWVAGAPVPGAGCGRVRLAAEHIDDRGNVVATEMFDLPRTLFPGEHVTVELPVTPGAEDAALRFGLVHEGVTWFRDRGAADAVVPVPVTP
ncbi:MAG: hypothetical protein KatS3mg009_3349 [Acidimicrobiia bacterium]|nr:MAG: hypothetical protein KatS3mg009_3349 [Acidimicrobiia bacterium]